MAILKGAAQRTRVRKIALLGGVFVAMAQAQVSGEYDVKAAFLYNFAKFVEWPAQVYKTPSDPIVICVLGENPFGRALEDAVMGKSVEGRKLVVRQVHDGKQSGDCQILFICASEKKHWRSILEEVKTSGILTVGETEEFTASGGVISFKLEDGKVRFLINTDAAEQAKLRISSKLLSLAQIVKK
jgi:hypothetical protein